MIASKSAQLHDPFSTHHLHLATPYPTFLHRHLENDAYLILDLLATDRLIDSYSPMKRVDAIWNELLAVDLECGRAQQHHHHIVRTCTNEKELFLDLLRTDQEMDRSSRRSVNLHDSYATKAHSSMGRMVTADYNHRHDDYAIMMHLLAVDESVDGAKRNQKRGASEDFAVIRQIFLVDCQISGAKRRTLLVEDLRCLLEVDHFIDHCHRKRVGNE